MALSSREKGNIGENIACEYLIKRGFSILYRQYRKKWGEIDIIAQKDSFIHFVEVKSLRVSDVFDFRYKRPEENVHGLKVHHIRKIVNIFLEENNLNQWGFAFHIICVYLNFQTRKAKVRMMENIIL